jgi:hypothetical protein
MMYLGSMNEVSSEALGDVCEYGDAGGRARSVLFKCTNGLSKFKQELTVNEQQ